MSMHHYLYLKEKCTPRHNRHRVANIFYTEFKSICLQSYFVKKIKIVYT